jgi:hypothetical protein
MKRATKLFAHACLMASILFSISCRSTKLDPQEEVNMEDPASVSNFIFNGHGHVTLSIYRPRTLDEKVKEADLIVLGTATVFGDERVAITNFSGGAQPHLLLDDTNSIFPKPSDRGFSLYERKLRIDIKEILRPHSANNTNMIIFPFYFRKDRPELSRNYLNTPGVFFLVKNKHPERSEWTMLDRYNDWMEPETNAALVRASIKKQKR